MATLRGLVEGALGRRKTRKRTREEALPREATTAMAEEEAKYPQSINTEEVDLWKVNVKLVIPGFAVEKKLFKSATPKPGVSECDVKFDTESLEVNAMVKDKKGVPTKYNYKVKKLPGEINPKRSSFQVKKDIVTLELIKAEESSWAVTLSRSGLEQEP